MNTERDRPNILFLLTDMLRWNASHLTWPDWQKVIATYWGYCTFIDDQVKRVLYALERAGQLDNTVIIYSSDHGDMLGSHRLFNKMMNMYNETHQIPGELHNLAPKLGYKHVLRRMKDRMVKWLRDTNDGIVNDGGWQSNSYDLFVSGRER